LSLDNQFQGKTVSPSAVAGEKPKENKFQILSLGLSTAYDFEAKTRKWSDLNITGSTSYNIVRISGNYDFWLYDQSGMLSRPLLRNYSLNLSTNTLAAKGTLWEGDKIVLNGIYPKDDLRYHNAGPQTWQPFVLFFRIEEHAVRRVRPAKKLQPQHVRLVEFYQDLVNVMEQLL
jgi:hypothetical protein